MSTSYVSQDGVRWAWNQAPKLKTTLQVSVLTALARHFDSHGEAYPGIRRLAQLAKANPRSVTRTLRQLVELGVLKVRYNVGKWRTNLYRALGWGSETQEFRPSEGDSESGYPDSGTGSWPGGTPSQSQGGDDSESPKDSTEETSGVRGRTTTDVYNHQESGVEEDFLRSSEASDDPPPTDHRGDRRDPAPEQAPSSDSRPRGQRSPDREPRRSAPEQARPSGQAPRAGEVRLDDGKCYPTDGNGVPITGDPVVDAGNRAKWQALVDLCRNGPNPLYRS